MATWRALPANGCAWVPIRVHGDHSTRRMGTDHGRRAAAVLGIAGIRWGRWRKDGRSGAMRIVRIAPTSSTEGRGTKRGGRLTLDRARWRVGNPVPRSSRRWLAERCRARLLPRIQVSNTSWRFISWIARAGSTPSGTRASTHPRSGSATGPPPESSALRAPNRRRGCPSCPVRLADGIGPA